MPLDDVVHLGRAQPLLDAIKELKDGHFLDDVELTRLVTIEEEFSSMPSNFDVAKETQHNAQTKLEVINQGHCQLASLKDALT